MSRSGVGPFTTVGATLKLGVVAIGVPLWAIARFSGPLLPVRGSDFAFLLALVCWAIVTKAVVERDQPIDSLIAGQGTPLSYAHRMVDDSMLGVGMIRSQHAVLAPLATTVVMPRELHPRELPKPLAVFDFGQSEEQPSAVVHAVPTLQAEVPDGPAITDTEEYVVARGDTFWSIAAATLGDGRHWQLVRELNVGREVSPDRTLVESEDLRIGWSILVPVVPGSGVEDAN